jgi:hypothetical protein
MSTATTTSEDVWVTGAEAKRLAKLTWYRLHTLAIRGKVRTLAEPGVFLRYHREDLEALASAAPTRRRKR